MPVSRQLISRASTGTRGVRIRLPLLKTAMPSKASPTTLNQRLSGPRQHGHNKNIRRGALIISHQQRWHPPWTSFDDVDEKFRGLVGLLEIIWLRSTAGTSIRDLPISEVRGASYESLWTRTTHDLAALACNDGPACVSRTWRHARWVMLVCVWESMCKPITPLLGSVYKLGEEAPIQGALHLALAQGGSRRHSMYARHKI